MTLIIKHEAVKNTGSFEVRFRDGRPSKFFYWDDDPSRRVHPDMLTSEQALERRGRSLMRNVTRTRDEVRR
jgi:hypothetical protein